MVRGGTRLAAVLLVAVLLTGCTAQNDPAPDQQARSAGARPVVVAVIDSGINPYHEAFRSEAFEGGVLENLIGPVSEVNLSPASSRADGAEADRRVWESLKPGELYHFRGTRILAVSMLHATGGTPIILDMAGHGTATAGIVAKGAPEALIVLVQGSGELCTDACNIDPSLPNGVAWAANQSWVDIISISFGNTANQPDDPTLHPEMRTYLEATRKAAAAGKVVVAAAGNDPSPTVQGYTCGPPWIICVGGFEPATRGASAYHSHGVDFIANVTALAPVASSTSNYSWRSGTSFSAPDAAAAFAEGMGSLRREGYCLEMNVTCLHDLRMAANASARRMSPTDFDPTAAPQDNPLLGKVFVPSVPIVAGPAQQGWGVVDSTIVDALVKAFKSRAGPPTDETSQFQAEYQSAREAVWSR